MGLPSFSGAPDGDAYFYWEAELEHYFARYNYSDADKCYFAPLLFTGKASRWWTELNFLSHIHKVPKISTWNAMKRELQQQFVPPRYLARVMLQKEEDARIEEERLRILGILAKWKKQSEQSKQDTERFKKKSELFWAKSPRKCKELKDAMSTRHEDTIATVEVEKIKLLSFTQPSHKA